MVPRAPSRFSASRRARRERAWFALAQQARARLSPVTALARGRREAHEPILRWPAASRLKREHLFQVRCHVRAVLDERRVCGAGNDHGPEDPAGPHLAQEQPGTDRSRLRLADFIGLRPVPLLLDYRSR
eukprot:2683990-Pleurochrysis_carterae.AAC.2